MFNVAQGPLLVVVGSPKIENKADVNGNLLSDAEWEKRKAEFLPSDSDREFIESLMQPQMEPGKFASWIAPPRVGIDNKPGDFEYVKIADA